MKNCIRVLMLLIFFITLFTSNAISQTWDYISKGTGTSATPLDWNTAASWFQSDGVTTAVSAPAAGKKVKIVAGDYVQIAAASNCGDLEVDGNLQMKAALNCDNVTVPAGGSIFDVGSQWSGDWTSSYIYTGVSTSTPIIHVDGTLGSSSYQYDGIRICPKVTVSSLTIEGNGGIYIRSLYPESVADIRTGAAAIDMNIAVNANMTLRANLPHQSYGSQASSLSLQSGSPFNNNRILTIAAGKTVTIPGLGNFHTKTGDISFVGNGYQTQGNCTYNILGTLDFTCADNGGNFNVATNLCSYSGQSQVITVDIKNGGKLRFGGNGAKVCNIGVYTNNASWGSQQAKILSETGSAIEFYGNAAPVITTGYGTNGGTTLPTFPTSVDNLIINNSAGVSMPNNITIGTLLTLTQGTLNTGTNTLTLNTGAAATIAPAGILVVSTGGTANFNGQAVTLQSNATGTGSIGNVQGTISGGNNVTVQRYLSSNTTWRGIGVPVSGGVTAVTGNTYVYTEANDDQINYGSSNATPNTGWTKINSGNFAVNTGYLIWNSTSQTLSNTGTINSGTQSLAVSKSKAGWNFLANPLPCNISWTAIAANNTAVTGSATAAVYRVNPVGTNSSSFSSFIPGTGGTNGGSDVIENGAAFFIQAVSAGSLNVREADKTANAVGSTSGGVTLFGVNDNISYKNIDNGSLKLGLQSESNPYTDEVILKWSTVGTEKFNMNYDAMDLGTHNMHDLSIVGNDATRYSIYNGTALLNNNIENRVIALGLKQLIEGNYQINTQLLSGLSNGNVAYLVDNYLHQSIAIDNSNPVYKFTVTADAGSKADGRFSIALNYKEIPDGNVAANFSLLNNLTSQNAFVLHSNIDVQKLEWKLVNANGATVQAGILNNITKGSSTQVSVNKAAGNIYFIQLNADGKLKQTLKWGKF